VVRNDQRSLHAKGSYQLYGLRQHAWSTVGRKAVINEYTFCSRSGNVYG
jgi:hypothetical protein